MSEWYDGKLLIDSTGGASRFSPYTCVMEAVDFVLGDFSHLCTYTKTAALEHQLSIAEVTSPKQGD